MITDGGISEDSYGCEHDTMRYTSDMVDGPVTYDPSCSSLGLQIYPGAYALCNASGLTPCDVDSITTHMKNDLNVSILNVLVGTASSLDPSRMSTLSSCDTATVDETCVYLQKDFSDFDELAAAAATIAQDVSVNVGIR